jgi:hypothetical protein
MLGKIRNVHVVAEQQPQNKKLHGDLFSPLR